MSHDHGRLTRLITYLTLTLLLQNTTLIDLDASEIVIHMIPREITLVTLCSVNDIKSFYSVVFGHLQKYNSPFPFQCCIFDRWFWQQKKLQYKELLASLIICYNGMYIMYCGNHNAIKYRLYISSRNLHNIVKIQSTIIVHNVFISFRFYVTTTIGST